MSSQPLPAQSNLLFHYLFEQASLGIAVEDLEGKLLLANPALGSMLGYSESELLSMSCSQFASPEDSADDWALFQQLRAGVIDKYSLEKRYVRKDGTRLWGRLNVSLLKNTDEESSPLVFAFVEDITERKQAEGILQESEERLRLAATAGKMYAYSWDPTSDVVTRSGEFANILGLRDAGAPLTRQELATRVHPDDRVRFITSVDHLTPENPTTQITYRLLRSDGAVIWLEKSGRAFFDAQGRLLSMIGMVADITERKRAEEELQQRNMELAEAQRLAGLGTWQWNAKTDQVIWSKEIYLRAGHDPSLPAPRFGEQANLFTAESWDRLRRAVEEAVQSGTPYELDVEIVDPKSTAKWATTRGEPLRDTSGQIIGLRGTIQDITQHKQAEKALRESEERIRLAMAASKSVGWEWDLKSGLDSWFGDLQTVFGISAEMFVGRTEDFFRYVHEEDRQRVAKAVADARQSRKPYAAEFRVVRPDGTERWIAARGEFYYGTNGEPERMLGMAADVTERKRAEVALRESEQRFRLAVQAGRMYAFDWDVVSDVIVRSIESAQILHWKNPERDTGREFHARIHPDDRELYAATEARLTPENPSYQISFRTPHPDGAVTWLEDTGRASFDVHGKMVRVIGMVADITERKRAEQALRESEDRLRLLLDSTAEAIYGIDLEHRCTFCNPACLRALGYERMDDVLGKNMHDLIHYNHADGTSIRVEECRIHQVMRTGEGVHAENEVLWRANGTSFPAEYWSYPQRRGHEVVGAVVAFIDITDRKLAEVALANVSRRLIQAQEQERTRIGRELHDDIGQRLALVAVELRRLQDDSVTLPGVRSRMSELQKQVSAIAVDIQSLSHELHSAKLQYLGIASAMRGFCYEFGEQQRVEIEFNAHDLPTPLSADISLCLFRILQEALHNSAKHSGGRHFEVRLWGTTDEVHLTIKDSGAGFDLETARTSRGLGLISMEERLKLLNGTLSIESQSNRGTTIHARVPLGSGSESMRAAG